MGTETYTLDGDAVEAPSIPHMTFMRRPAKDGWAGTSLSKILEWLSRSTRATSKASLSCSWDEEDCSWFRPESFAEGPDDFKHHRLALEGL